MNLNKNKRMRLKSFHIEYRNWNMVIRRFKLVFYYRNLNVQSCVLIWERIFATSASYRLSTDVKRCAQVKLKRSWGAFDGVKLIIIKTKASRLFSILWDKNWFIFHFSYFCSILICKSMFVCIRWCVGFVFAFVIFYMWTIQMQIEDERFLFLFFNWWARSEHWLHPLYVLLVLFRPVDAESAIHLPKEEWNRPKNGDQNDSSNRFDAIEHLQSLQCPLFSRGFSVVLVLWPIFRQPLCFVCRQKC